ncbi:MAG: phospholipase D-like domain-containing protein [Patescibacteria group bacterium]
MKYKFYTVSFNAWDAMLGAIKLAEKSIYWECYILLDDTPTHNFFDILKEKARQGVVVKIIADAIGSFWLGSSAVNDLRAAGVEILFFNHRGWFNRNHKKILIIDEKIGFIGGVNIAKAHRHWLDLHLKVEGLIARALLRSFIKSYKISGGKDNLVHQKIRLHRKIRILDHLPFLSKSRSLRKFYIEHINNAKDNILIATPYFVPHLWLIKALKNAARRGVKIEIIMPKETDHRIITWLNRLFVYLVGEKGIDFYFSSKMIHAKALLVDDQEGLVGSNNIDAASFEFNSESGLVFKRKDMLKDLKNIFEAWKKESIRSSY